ncbi:unnamed protein product [Rhizophagus irregularis]|nr:unnamed protein product [Rhizophagus irregularis]
MVWWASEERKPKVSFGWASEERKPKVSFGWASEERKPKVSFGGLSAKGTKIRLDGFEAAYFEIFFFIYRFLLFVGIEPTGTMSKPLTTLIKIKGTLAVSA